MDMPYNRPAELVARAQSIAHDIVLRCPGDLWREETSLTLSLAKPRCNAEAVLKNCKLFDTLVYVVNCIFKILSYYYQ
jgi:hypothetical protein